MIVPENKFKFISYSFVPFIVAYLFYCGLLHFYVYPEYNLFSARALAKNSYLDHSTPSEVDYLIIGDSSGMYSINPLILSENSFNMASVGQTAYFTYKKLSSIPKLKIKKGIIITQTFIPDHYNEDVWSILIPIGEMSLPDVLEMHCPDLMNDCSIGKKMGLISKYFSHKFYLSAQSMSDFTKFIASNSHSDHLEKLKYFKSFITQYKGHYSSPTSTRSSHEEIENSWKKNFIAKIEDCPTSEKKYLNLISNWAKDKNIPLYFFIAPLASQVFPQFDTSAYSGSIQTILNQIDIPRERIIDSKNFKKLFNEDDFVDINHINEDGARKNTLALKNVLVTLD